MLSYNKNAGSYPSDCFQVAKYNNKIIYYHDVDNNKIDSMDYDDISELVDYAVDELGINDIPFKKLSNVEDDLLAGDRPRDRQALKVYKKAKETLAIEESKIFMPDTHLKKISLVPTNKPNQVDTIYVSATNGAGKSTIASNFAINYHIENPNNRIFLFAYKSYDPAFDGRIPNLIRITLDRNFIRDNNATESVNMYKNSLLIFDEIDLVENKDIRNTLMNLKNRALQLGRANGTSVISIQHKSLGGQMSLVEFTECKTIVIFPKNDFMQARQVLRKLNFDKFEIDSILDPIGKRQRWMAILKPNILVTENYVKIIDL